VPLLAHSVLLNAYAISICLAAASFKGLAASRATPEELARFTISEHTKWADVAAAGIEAQ